MAQLGQVVQMKSKTAGGEALWGYRYRTGGRGSRRVQRGGFMSERDAGEALERALERLRRANGTASTLTLAELVDEYLAQHDAQPETIEKLRWLLTKAVLVFGDRRLGQLRPQEIAAWRMTIPPGHRFEATQDRKSTRLNSSHVRISYAVFCLKKTNSDRGNDPTEKKKKSNKN